MTYQRNCVMCGKSFLIRSQPNKKFCGRKCAGKFRYSSKYKRKTLSEERKCNVCRTSFKTGNHPTKVYCSLECSNKNFTSGRSPFAKMIPTGTVGAIGELRVAIDLLSKKYEVFKALSPSCSCDLAILKNGKLKTIEVRTGNEIMLRSSEKYKKKYVKAEILAIVDYANEKIIYYPNEP